MTDKTTKKTSSDDSFDLDQFERLCEMMDKHDLREVELSRGSQTWAVRRGPQEVAVAAAPVAAAPAPAPAAAPTQAASAPAATDAPAPASSGNFITSPTVGTFYTKPDPNDPPFVAVGDSVQADTIVCLIEAMKVFNQIPADKAGKITKVLVEEGAPVEFGQPLFELA